MWVGAGRPLAEQQAVFGDAVEEQGVAARVDPVDAAGEDGDGAAGSGQGAPVGGRVDAEGAARDDRPAPLGQPVAQLGRDVLAVVGAGPGPDDRHRPLAQASPSGHGPRSQMLCGGSVSRAIVLPPARLSPTRSSSWGGHSASSGVTMRAPIRRAFSWARSASWVGSTVVSRARPAIASRRAAGTSPAPEAAQGLDRTDRADQRAQIAPARFGQVGQRDPGGPGRVRRHSASPVRSCSASSTSDFSGTVRPSRSTMDHAMRSTRS